MAAITRAQDMGKNNIPLTVKLKKPADSQALNPLADGLKEMYRKGDFTDVSLICADRTYRAHRCILAARSEVFFQGLATPPGDAAETKANVEVRLADVSNPEAVKFMLDHIYQLDDEDYNPRSQDINKDVLKLAQNFKLTGLLEQATRYLAQDLSTGNVVERLTICEDFALEELKEKILEQLTFNKLALAEVASSPQIICYPKLMQSMLKLAAAVPAAEAEPAATVAEPRRKIRKAGA